MPNEYISYRNLNKAFIDKHVVRPYVNYSRTCHDNYSISIRPEY